MLDKLLKHAKYSTVVMFALVIMMTTAVVAYVVNNYITTETQTSVFTKEEYFEKECYEMLLRHPRLVLGKRLASNRASHLKLLWICMCSSEWRCRCKTMLGSIDLT